MEILINSNFQNMKIKIYLKLDEEQANDDHANVDRFKIHGSEHLEPAKFAIL